MAVAEHIKEMMTSPSSGIIRRMFEEGMRLKEIYGEDNVYDFSLGNPDLDPPAEVSEEFARIAGSREKNFHGYMPNAGYPEARRAMAEKTSQEQGVSVGPECVVMSVGAAGALNALLKAILNPGDEVIVPSPFFAEYRHYVGNYGGKLVEVPCGKDFSPDCVAIGRALSVRTAAVLVNSPNNPTGRVYTQDEIHALAETLRDHAGKSGRAPWLICDEPYRAITYDGARTASVFTEYENSVVVTSFAKNLSLPGERIGYIAVNGASPGKDELVAACVFTTRILGYVNAPGLMQRVVARTWSAPADYSPYRKRRDELMANLDAAGIEYVRPQGAFYLWCRVPDGFGGDDMAFCEHLKKYRILGAPGSGFGGKGWFRLAYCVSEEIIRSSRAAFIKAMENIG